MTLLNVLTVALGYKRPMYDFVYMPWAKLAIVNFVDHESCKVGVLCSVTHFVHLAARPTSPKYRKCAIWVPGHVSERNPLSLCDEIAHYIVAKHLPAGQLHSQ